MADVVVIAPHPDDESIGCGGAICLHRQQGHSVHVVFLTSGERGLKQLAREEAQRVREEEAVRAAEVLDIRSWNFLRLADGSLDREVAEAAAQLRPILKREFPAALYVPHPDDGHPDHKAALPIVRAALEGTSLPRHLLRGYEVWTPLTEYHWVRDVTSVMARKLRAIRCYRSQLSQFRYDRAIRGLNRYRGVLAAHCKYAEAFRFIARRSDPSADSPTQQREEV